MKLERLTKKVGGRGKVETFTGRDWIGKRFYLDARRGHIDTKPILTIRVNMIKLDTG